MIVILIIYFPFSLLFNTALYIIMFTKEEIQNITKKFASLNIHQMDDKAAKHLLLLWEHLTHENIIQDILTILNKKNDNFSKESIIIRINSINIFNTLPKNDKKYKSKIDHNFFIEYRYSDITLIFLKKPKIPNKLLIEELESLLDNNFYNIHVQNRKTTKHFIMNNAEEIISELRKGGFIKKDESNS